MKQMIAIMLLPTLVSAIPWPLIPADSTHKIDGSYGGSNIPWLDASPSNPMGNFHSGIDLILTELTLPGQEEVVYSVEAGYVTDVMDGAPPSAEQWFVICESLDSEEGWAYLHVANPFGIEKEDSLSLYDSLACIHQDTSSTSHLHFMRSGREFSTAYGPAGHLNPLSVLDPSATGSDYEWQFDPQPQSPQHPWCYFLTDNTIESWEDDWIVSTDIYADTLSTDNLHGSVDLIQGFSLWGYGDCGIQPGIGESWLVPYRIRWDLVLKGENPASDQVLVEKYLVSFDGIVGDYDDWEKYRQFFFRFPDLQTYFPGYSGDIICLTNCGDATGWTGLGISNIEEGCWNTALALDGTGENYNPILQDSSASDGFYRIDVTAYAWDTTDSQRVSIDCRVCNTREIAQSVVLTDAASRSEVWRAEWEAVETANGFEPVKNVLVDAPADPGSTLEIEIVFTGPMDTSVEPFVRFAKAGGTYLVADPATVEWTSTYLPSGYYDTWHGTVDVPSSGMSGWLTMQIKAKDNTGLGLLDPSDADPDPPVMDRYEDYTDTHHGFGIAFGPETVWDGELNHQVESSPVLADMDGDGDLDVGILDRDGWVHLLDDDGTSMNTNWPSSGSWEPWFPYPVRCSPAIADLDEDGDLDIVYQGSWTGQACDVATGDDIDGWLVECGTSGSPGYFCSYSSPSVGDTDGDDHLEVVIGRVISDTTDLKSSVFLFEDTGGTATWSRTLTPTSTGVSICATPVIGDVDGDDDVDVLVATADDYFQDIYSPGMPAATNQSAVYLLNSSTGATIWQQTFPYCQILGSPVVADLEGDETNEVIFGTANAPTSYRKIHILSGETGSIEHSLSVPGWVMGPVGIGDLDEDGYLDIVAGVNGTPGQIYAWSGAGSHALLPGFPASVIGNPCGGISIVDMDADFELEIVAGTSSGWLYAVNPDGSVCTGFPVDTGSSTMGQVAAGDIDGDGSLELVGADATLAQAWCYDMGSGSYPSEMPWRQFQHDSWHSGCFEADNTIPEAPTDLAASVTYNMYGYTAELTWDLSVNDPYSGSPEEPADVLSYQIYRAFPPGGFSILGRTHAGEGSYTDVCNDPQGIMARYVVTSADGVNESEYSNEVRFRTVPGLNLALGCAVREEREQGRIAVSEAAVGSGSASSRIPEAVMADRVEASSSAWLLTDGEKSEEYIPEAGVSAVVIDLGRPSGITGVSIESDGSSTTVGASSSTIEISRDGSAWASVADGASMTSLTGRYVRLSPAPSATEVFVWGDASEESSTASIGIERSDGRWNLALPVLDDTHSGETGTLSVYDVTGRVLRSWNARPGEEVDWDGRTASGMQVTPGCYFVRYEQGGEAVTRRLLVTSE